MFDECDEGKLGTIPKCFHLTCAVKVLIRLKTCLTNKQLLFTNTDIYPF